MKKPINDPGRRQFIKSAAILSTALIAGNAFGSENTSPTSKPDDLYVIGPLEGYSPQVGTLVSMLNYNRQTIIDAVKSLTMAELDHLHDEKSNSIGALILHLGATEKFYQVNTFDGREDFNEEEKKVWEVAQVLGEEGRKTIKGHEVKYYLDRINEVRQKTLQELKKKDDKWLMAIDPKWSKEKPFNTYWKWFHVCEHESNHRGQITWLKRRLPGAKPGDD
ncbi:MAG: DinB family protein [Bacteroidota bacterium]